jgi:predicted nucleotidyltransferase
MQKILKVLQEAFDHPVDIEFAHDGTNFYLLQCRAQPYSKENISITIPRDIPREKIIFTANRFVSNGRVDDIAYIVYVDPQKYHEISNYQDLAAVGRVVGRLNKILPKRRFILIGPGRWGSRGDIKLGVSVTYSDINNTAALIEIARKKKNYVPELSFGTHFFQDLVEASISYLPLYPDDAGVIYNEPFLTGTLNLLKELIPDLEPPLSDAVRVIHVPASADGRVLRLLMSADAEEAMAYLVEPSEAQELHKKRKKSPLPEQSQKDTHWHWRLQAVESIAAHLDAARFGVKNFYVFGSTKNATAGPQSDIDILIHFRGSAEQRQELSLWLEGWSASLSQINYERTGLKTDGLLDVHLITDEDIIKGSSYASKIGALTDAARLLPMGAAFKH